MQILKQSTGAQKIYVYLVDATDGYTPETGITSPSLYLSKNGGGAGVPNDGAWSEIDATNMPGVYTVGLNATDTATVGPGVLHVLKAGCRSFAVSFYVSASLLDTIYSKVSDILTDTGTDGVVISAATVPAALIDAVWDEAIYSHLAVGSVGKKLNDAVGVANPWEADPSAYTDLATFGGAIARAIGGSGSSAYTLTVQDPDDVPLEGVSVDVYDDTLTTDAHFITRQVTNASGQVSLYLPAGNYYVYRYKRGYGFDDPLTITVT